MYMCSKVEKKIKYTISFDSESVLYVLVESRCRLALSSHSKMVLCSILLGPFFFLCLAGYLHLLASSPTFNFQLYE